MQLMRDKPGQLNKIYDQHTRSKVPMDFEIYGKPNHMLSFSKLDVDIYEMSQLTNMKPEEFVQMAEHLMDDPRLI